MVKRGSLFNWEGNTRNFKSMDICIKFQQLFKPELSGDEDFSHLGRLFVSVSFYTDFR